MSLAFYEHRPRILSGPAYVAVFLSLHLALALLLAGFVKPLLCLARRRDSDRRMPIVVGACFAGFLLVYALPHWDVVFADRRFSAKALAGLGAMVGGALAAGAISAGVYELGRRVPRIGVLSGTTGGLAAVAVAAAFWNVEPSESSLPSVSARRAPQSALPVPDTIVILSFDALRADHLSAWGYPRETSPELDRFLSESLRFERARSTRSSTAPSLASLLTGVHPPRHGLMTNGWRLGEGVPTLPSMMHASWNTAAFVANPVVGPGVESADFDHFEIFDRSPAPEVLASALAWLEQNPYGPVLLWVHLFEPHGPYEPPTDERRRFVGDALYDTHARLPYSVSAAAKYLGIPTRPEMDVRRAVDETVASYDAFIRFGTRHASDFLDRVRELRRQPLFVVTADHGESMVEHDYFFFHGANVYDTEVRVPLAIRYDAAGLRGVSQAPASLVDVVPTLCAVVGCDGLSGALPLDGLDLLDEVRASRDRAVFAASLEHSRYNRWAIVKDGWKLTMTPLRVTSLLDGVLELRYRIIAPLLNREEVPNPYRFHIYDSELFHTAADPGETRNRTADEPVRNAGLAEELLAFLDRQYLLADRRPEASQEITSEMEVTLRSLGYLR